MLRISKLVTVMPMTTNESSLNQAVADVLRGEMATLRWTLATLSAASDIPKVSVQRYLKGARDIDVAVLDKLARAMGTDAVSVMTAAMEHLDRPLPPKPPTGETGLPNVGDAV